MASDRGKVVWVKVPKSAMGHCVVFLCKTLNCHNASSSFLRYIMGTGHACGTMGGTGLAEQCEGQTQRVFQRGLVLEQRHKDHSEMIYSLFSNTIDFSPKLRGINPQTL